MGVFAPPSPFCEHLECVKEAEILVQQQTPQGVFDCDHAGLVMNKFSLRVVVCRGRDDHELGGSTEEGRTDTTTKNRLRSTNPRIVTLLGKGSAPPGAQRPSRGQRSVAATREPNGRDTPPVNNALQTPSSPFTSARHLRILTALLSSPALSSPPTLPCSPPPSVAPWCVSSQPPPLVLEHGAGLHCDGSFSSADAPGRARQGNEGYHGAEGQTLLPELGSALSHGEGEKVQGCGVKPSFIAGKDESKSFPQILALEVLFRRHGP